MSSIFTKIINKELPGEIIYESDQVIALLDIFPANFGHTLIIPKHEVPNYLENSLDDLTAVMQVAQLVGHALMQLPGVEGINLISNTGEAAGQKVFHTHFHVIPRFSGDGHQAWQQKEYASDEDKVEMANKLRDMLMAPMPYTDLHPTNPIPKM
jgi:histidine triad (HIT) family protein